MTRKQFLNLKPGTTLRIKSGHENAGMRATVADIIGGRFLHLRVLFNGREMIAPMQRLPWLLADTAAQAG